MTMLDVKRARDREVTNLEHRRRELADAQKRVDDLHRQIANVERSIEQLDERLASFTDAERIEQLEERVVDLEDQLNRARSSVNQLTYVYGTGTTGPFFRQ